MTACRAVVGAKVKTNVDFYQLPSGSTGVIVEDYGTGVFVLWDGRNGLKDGFDKETGLHTLDLIEETANTMTVVE